MDTQEAKVKVLEQEAAELVEVMPEPVADIVPYDAANAEERAAIDQRVAELDIDAKKVATPTTNAAPAPLALSERLR